MTNPTDEKDQIWTRRNYEPSKAYNFFCIFRDMGPNRTIEKVVTELKERSEKEPSGVTDKVPVASTLYNYSAKWDWLERTESYDNWQHK